MTTLYDSILKEFNIAQEVENGEELRPIFSPTVNKALYYLLMTVGGISSPVTAGPPIIIYTRKKGNK
jgi:hypothetical protein